MNMLYVPAVVTAFSVSVVPAPQVRADSGWAFLGGIIAGSVMAHNAATLAAQQEMYDREATASYVRQQRALMDPPPATAVMPDPAVSSRDADVQAALSFFGYAVGRVDGVLGRQSRAAIAQFQQDMGWTATGTLGVQEEAFLIDAHQRGEAALTVPPYNEIVASQGRKGLLEAFRREELGQPVGGGQGGLIAEILPAGDASQPVHVLASTEPGKGSMAAFCKVTAQRTEANGGTVQPGPEIDMPQAMGEQFCWARRFAIGDTALVESSIPPLSPEQLAADCGSVTGIMAPFVAQLERETPRRIIAQIKSAQKESGERREMVSLAARLCLGTAYRIEDPDMALGAALLVTAMGQIGYGEMVSHHLRQGFGTAPAGSLAIEPWMDLALQSPEGTEALGQNLLRLGVLRQYLES